MRNYHLEVSGTILHTLLKGDSMSDWTAGYVADIGYTYGYYGELNPLRLKLAFLNAGLDFPDIGTACELGFGQGISINSHAAASLVEWHGTDFNPSQAAFAQSVASASGANAHLHDDAFDAFCQRDDLPDFDYIGLHGIWSWISDENRAVIVDFVRRKLKVGGVLYISYNTQPGWASFAPMRHLMREHGEVMGAEGHGIVPKVDAAINFAEQLLATNPTYARANPQVNERLNQIKNQNRQYLAHEYFNHDWLPMHFSTLAEWLSSAKLGFACSAHYLDHVTGINLTQEQRALLEQLPDRLFRETVRDFMVNQQFRRDYWVKGPRQVNGLERSEQLRAQRIILTSPRHDVSLKVKGALGEADMNESIYAPILDAMADHKPRSLGELEKALQERVNLAQISEAVTVLIGGGHIAPVQDENTLQKAKKRTDKLNLHLMDKARGSDDVTYLASPVIGGSVKVVRFHQLFLLARSQGIQQPEQWAAFVWQLLKSQGQQLVKEGKTVQGDEQNIAELKEQAIAFAEQQLPILKALHIA